MEQSNESKAAWLEIIEQERFVKRKKTDFQKQLYPIFETALKNKAIDKPIINLYDKEKLFESYSIDFERWLNGNECNESNFIAYLKNCKAEKKAAFQKVIDTQKAEYNKWNIDNLKPADTPPPHFTIALNEEQLLKLYTGLVKNEFLPTNTTDTDLKAFSYIFGGNGDKTNFKPLMWIKTNSTTQGKTLNKKSLLNLLEILKIHYSVITNVTLLNKLLV